MDESFTADAAGLRRALELLLCTPHNPVTAPLPDTLPEYGMGEAAALEALAPLIVGGAAPLGAPISFAHMDPPTPWVTWAIALWNASLNQNLLHPATAPIARTIEHLVIDWLAPYFGMQGGHFTPGSTVANLTALWAARECVGVTEVVASEGAHLSVEKSARLLGLQYRTVPSDAFGAMIPDALSGDLQRAALVLTAETTSTGALDPLSIVGRAAWTHIDAAWAGPLRLCPDYAAKLDGINDADSVSVSAHKWLFQPKESGFVLFRDVQAAHAAITFSGAYLAALNVGLLGSHGANAAPLLATLLAWGRTGMAARIERCMALSYKFADFVEAHEQLELLSRPETGIIVWRPRDTSLIDPLFDCLPRGSTSLTTVVGERWMRNVAANPNADIDGLVAALKATIGC